MTYTEKQLQRLALAKQLYTPGTEYHCAEYKWRTSKNHPEFTIRADSDLRFHNNDPNKIDAFGIGFIYYKGIWADIIKHGKPINTDYDIF